MSSHKVIRESFVEEALRLDKGDEAQLLSWTTEDINKKGNNYTSFISSVTVKYCKATVNQEVTYVVKLKPQRENGLPSEFDNLVFNKEGLFYTELLSEINAELSAAGQKPLLLPSCYHSRWEEGQNQLFLEDLRPRGFKMYDRTKGLDVHHAILVLQELGRLHAASHQLQAKAPKQDLTQKFKFLTWEWFNYSERTRKEFDALITGSLTVASGLAKAIGYEKIAKWYKDVAPRAMGVVEEQIASSQFDVVCHGDCFTNNMMFRYNEESQPVEVVLLDLQICRKSSLGTDLSYLLFSSIDEPERTGKLEEFLGQYHASFKAVIEGGGTVMPFTLLDITKEFHNKSVYGWIMSSFLIPILVAQSHEIPDFTVATDGHIEDFIEQQQQIFSKMLRNNPLLKLRLANLYESMDIE
ncbi:uncharacterized protein LOC121878786 [Homarus americanus]|uniref:uncharacterized protein LOC121878786 n=1 Tax=Homarus americanus TaxID=6706 RepID=UPI001C465043|nr:uncharacterized protein LOC121878786 [Homarus americanus]XP_042241135.1 uncharacterized protein LOC121878786 [Homarus americanus]